MNSTVKDCMMDILSTMEPHTKAFSIDALTPDDFRMFLAHLNLTVPDDMTKDKMEYALSLSTVYMEKFKPYPLGKVVVFFNECDVVNIVSSDKKVSLYELNCQYPCSVCHFNVDDEGEMGQGLECSVCESWFHNNCTDSPLEDDLYNRLTDSPCFIKICCPPCLKNGQVKRLQKQINIVESNLNNQFADLKKLVIDSKNVSDIISNEVVSVSNMSAMFTDLKDAIKKEISVEINSIKKECFSELASTNRQLNSQCENVIAMKSELSKVTTELLNIRTRVVDITDYFSDNDLVNSTQQIKKTVDMVTDAVEEMNMTEVANEYKVVVDQIKQNTDNLALCVENNMSTLCQSTDHAIERLSGIAELDTTKVSASLSTLDTACKEQIVHVSSLANVVKDATDKMKEDIRMDDVALRIADKVCVELSGNKCVSLCNDVTAAKTPYSVATSQRSQQSSGGSSVSTSLASKSSIVSHKPTHIHMNEGKTISVGNIKDKDMVISSARIKSQFNKCFPRMEIVHCKRSMNGFVLIEVDTPANAKQVVAKWDGNKFFNTALDIDNPTVAILLEDVRAKAVIVDVDKDFSDEEITANIQSVFPSAKARRYINKHGPTHCVLLTFNTKNDLDKAFDSRVVINDIPFKVRPYEARRTPVQCFNCYGYRHIASHCRRKQICPYCSQSHDEKDCLIKKDNLTDQFKCCNCKGNHTALDKNCDQYKQMLHNISQHNNDQQR